MDKLKDAQAWWLLLEAERFDQSYKKPAPTRYAPEVRVIDKPVDYRWRDSVMFQAGRYSAGCRDVEALNGHKQMIKIAKKEKGGKQ